LNFWLTFSFKRKGGKEICLDFPACRQAGLLLFLSRKKVKEERSSGVGHFSITFFACAKKVTKKAQPILMRSGSLR